MYGSHNSLTGYKPMKWWGRLLQPFARCQRTAVEEQIEGGARAFDLRVRFGKGGLVACHGLVEYKADVPAGCGTARKCRVLLPHNPRKRHGRTLCVGRRPRPAQSHVHRQETPALPLCERKTVVEHDPQPALQDTPG